MRINIRSVKTQALLETIITPKENVLKLCELITMTPEYGGIEIDYYFEITAETKTWETLPGILATKGWVVKRLDDKEKSLEVTIKKVVSEIKQ